MGKDGLVSYHSITNLLDDVGPCGGLDWRQLLVRDRALGLAPIPIQLSVAVKPLKAEAVFRISWSPGPTIQAQLPQ